MHKPNIPAILQEASLQRTAQGRSEISNDTRRKVAYDVHAALSYIATQEPLLDAHEKLTAEQVNKAVATYANELADGKIFPEKDAHLADMLSIAPVELQPAKAAPAAPQKEETAPLANLLRDPQNMRIFREEIDAAARLPSKRGYKAAKWLKPLLDDPQQREKLIEMFEKNDIFNPESTARIGNIAESDQAISKFLSELSRPQHVSLRNAATPATNTIPALLKQPDNEASKMSRRAALIAGVAGAMKVGSMIIENNAVKKFDTAIGAPLTNNQQKRTEGRADRYFGQNVQQVSQSDQSKQTQETAGLQSNGAYVLDKASYVVGAVALGAVAKRLHMVRSKHFRNEVADVLDKLDTIVLASEAKMKERSQNEGRA